ncbi:MAG: hypothetical protein HY578_10145 [Nitrospinae bacterium]|nr:hypothetical protein [Nitrospinota bacterium]
MRTAVVTTTINTPVFLKDYAGNVKVNRHNVFFVVIGDRKTPLTVKDYCRGLEHDTGIQIDYLDVQDQEGYLIDFPELQNHLMYDSIQRRNIGILIAYQKGAETIITIDDDNYFISSDFIQEHSLGVRQKFDVIHSKSGWFNVCSFLEEKDEIPFYHRGFPVHQRWKEEKIVKEKADIKIVVNSGLWVNEPDIDALTRLYRPVTAIKYLREDNFALGKGTWSPFNSQNTALSRDIVPAYFLSPYVGRYDDIWASYIISAIADHLGDSITFGKPVVRQDRNLHNFWKDMEKEKMGMIMTDRFCEILRKTNLTGTDYQYCFLEIIQAFEGETTNREIFSGEEEGFLQKFIEGLIVWHKTIQRIR